MGSRVRGLERLAELYGMIERLRSLDLRTASAQVNEAASYVHLQREAGRREVESGRAAIAAGDRQGWAIAESELELTRIRQARAEELRRARAALRETAADAYRASRMRMEQMQSVARQASKQEQAEERRRTQAALDDRHLARSLWKKTQDR
ncbi:hypothetical protein SAMN05421770_1011021 [Granulicella rosea]|uniref:Flagellar FliJ protein n=1 Tax=Granulicella rosea TaxID=474952 RepID=A0A239EKM3_9BACT|nr:hypothetical protein [Granulicella rosea]SNS44951.1 hypothetical protein SAMN05421770_1011021 [Granulicella rosea]